MKTRNKLTLAAAMVVAIMIGMATPAAAGGPYALETTGGTLSTAIGAFDLTPGSQGPPPGVCTEKANTLALRTGVDATPSGADRWSVSGGYASFFRLGTPPSGPWYQADFIFSGNGQFSGAGSPYALTGTINVQVRIYEIPNPDTSCAKTTLRCIVSGRFVITSGSYAGTLPNAATGDTLTLNATTGTTGGINLVTSSCVAPFVALNGTSASLAGMTIQVQ